MLKEYATIFRRVTMFVDICIITAAFFTGYFLRDAIHNIYPLKDYLWFSPIFVLVWIILLNFFEMYQSFRVKYISDVLFIIFKTAFVGLAIFGSCAFIFKLQYISRAFIAFIFLAATLFLIIEKAALIVLFRYVRR